MLLHIYYNKKIWSPNAKAIASSQTVDIYYDQRSTGSVFDLGVAYALNKPIMVLNKDEIVFNDNDPIDKIINKWPFEAGFAKRK